MLNHDDLEYLGIDQAASICCVSPERFAKWIEKGLVPVIECGERKLLRSHDLIQHLVRHNIRIPERLLQGTSRKVLFILMQADIPPAMTTEIIWALYRLREQSSFIFDFIEFDSTTELKLITFEPDLVLLLQKEADNGEAQQTIARMLGQNVPVRTFAADQPIKLDRLLHD
jgi:hypothetical protein